jgi:hypothetical protein
MTSEHSATQPRRPRAPWAARYAVTTHRVPAYLIALVLLITGCGTTSANRPGARHPAETPTAVVRVSLSDRADVPVLLRNPSPSILDISLSVTFDQPTAGGPAMTEVGLSFQSGGKVVQFTGDERVTCQGARLSLKDRSAVFQALRAPTAQMAGTTIRCDYTAGGGVAGIALQLPAAPAITSPLPDARVARGAQTLVTYRADPATSTLLGIVALAPSSPSPKALARMNVPGPFQATLDTSGFAPGDGSLALTASLTPHIAQTGAAFHSVSAFGTAMALVTVTWI